MEASTSPGLRAANEVKIGGESRFLPDFSGYKAIKAMEIVAEVNEAWQATLDAAADFKAGYEGKNVVTIDRAEARRQYPPKPLLERIPALDDKGELMTDEDGEPLVKIRPMLDAQGQPLMGPDPLGHLTEQDWAGSGQVLRIPDSPTTTMQIMHVAPQAFGRAQKHCLRILALVLTPNDELERWDMAGDPIDSKLDEEGKKLLHRAKADELVSLAVAAVEVGRDQLADPFEQAATAIRSLTSTPDRTPAPAAGPMSVETSEPDETASEISPPSPSPSSGTDGDTSTSPTEPRSVPSSPSAVA